MINLRKRFTAFVVFSGSENRNWWRFLTRRGWRHVFVVIPVYFPEPGFAAVQYSQVINTWTDHLRSDVVFEPPRTFCRRALKEGATCVISIAVDQKFSGRYIPRGFMTCVSLVKALISVRAWYVWTPEQLARYLLKHGGELMENPRDGRTIQQTENAGSRQGRSSCTAEVTASAGPGDQQTVG